MSTTTAYVTDSWSSLTGLASVAYGSPDLFPEVANQVVRGSFASPVAMSRPSEIAEVGLDLDRFTAALQIEYGKGGAFSDFVNLGQKSLSEISTAFYNSVIRSYDELASYGVTLTSILTYALGPNTGLDYTSLSNTLSTSSFDTPLYTQIATSLPTSKLDKVPPDAILDLSDNLPTGSDYRGIDMSLGYLTPADYFSGIAYPGVEVKSFEVPTSLLRSVESGYIGYPTTLPLDELLNSGVSSAISRGDIGSILSPMRALSGSRTVDAIRSLSPIGRLNPGDRAMYEVDLTSIILAKNGYTVYNPATDSNGNFADTSAVTNPDDRNNDPGRGLPFLQRPRQIT